eukprot:3302226-Amphidinium_carterae.1
MHGNSYIEKGANKTSEDTIEEVRHGEQAIIQLAQEAAKELTTHWRHSSSHTHQGQGAVKCLHETLFAQHYFLGCCNMLASRSTDTWRIQMGSRRIINNAGEYNASQQSAALARWSWPTSSQPQSTSWASETKSRRQKAFGWERQPTVVNTLLPQRTIQARFSTHEAWQDWRQIYNGTGRSGMLSHSTVGHIRE